MLHSEKCRYGYLTSCGIYILNFQWISVNIDIGVNIDTNTWYGFKTPSIYYEYQRLQIIILVLILILTQWKLYKYRMILNSHRYFLKCT